MKIAIVWDSASWKSTFWNKLSNILNIPTYHTDLFRVNTDWTKKSNMEWKKEIDSLLEKKTRIIEWNALQADPTKRFEHADIIFLFDFNRFTTLINTVRRQIKTKFKKQKRIWFHNDYNWSLNLKYFVPYILIHFPKRKEKLKKLLNKSWKIIIVFKSYADVNNYDFKSLK
jgi:adenylate kinase family enzyme